LNIEKPNTIRDEASLAHEEFLKIDREIDAKIARREEITELLKNLPFNNEREREKLRLEAELAQIRLEIFDMKIKWRDADLEWDSFK
jgi:hypothetical protein